MSRVAEGADLAEAEALDAYSRAVTAVAERLAPSVASLRVLRRTRGGRVPAGAGSAVVLTPDGFLLTSAHVVEGGDRRGRATFADGSEQRFEVVGRDPLSDLALLRAPALSGVPALRLNESAGAGASAAILGFPENGPYTVEPGRLGQTSKVVTQDAYGRGPVTRSIVSLRGRVRSGNSGGPMVDGAGRVVTTIFAASVSDGGSSGFGVPDGLVRQALRQASR